MEEYDDERILVKTPEDYRIELFTKNPDDHKDNEHITLRMGEFRVRREDNNIGERYFISDLRGENSLIASNALLVHTEAEKHVASNFIEAPHYSCQRLCIYRFGTYPNEDKSKVLRVDHSGITVDNL